MMLSSLSSRIRPPLVSLASNRNGRRFLSSSKNTAVVRDTGIWMKDLEGNELGSLAIMAPNLQWVVSNKGKMTLQKEKPSEFKTRVCTQKDLLTNDSSTPGPGILDQVCGASSPGDYYMSFVYDQIAERLAGGAFIDYDSELLQALFDFGRFSSAPEQMDPDAKFLLQYLKDVCEEEERDHVLHFYLCENRSSATLEDIAALKGIDDRIRNAARKTKDCGFRLDLDVYEETAEEYFGAPRNIFGEVYLSDGVTVPAETSWLIHLSPYLCLPCFDGEEKFVNEHYWTLCREHDPSYREYEEWEEWR